MRVITLTGASSNGKDRILNKLLEMNLGLTPIISTTSRGMRKGEKQNKEYHFVSDQEAIDMLKNNEFVEHRIYNVVDGTWIYGISKDSIDLSHDKTYIVIIDFQGLLQLESYLNANGLYDNVTSIYIDCNYQNRLIRSLSREGNMDNNQVSEVVRRFLDDNEKVLPAKNYCNYVVNNDGDFEVTIRRILDILENEV